MGLESLPDTTAEAVMAEEEMERRSFARIGINSRVEYRIVGEEAYSQGILDNLSANGALLWADQQFPLGTKIEITVKSDETGELPINITAVMVRIAGVKKESQFGYGCQIENTENA